MVKHHDVDLEEYFKSAGQTKYNSILMAARTRPTRKTEQPYRLVTVYQNMSVSPTNTLWFPAADWTPEHIEKNSSTFIGQRGLEYDLKTGGVSEYPTYVSAHLKYDISGDAADFERWFFRGIVQGINDGAFEHADYVSSSFDFTTAEYRHSGVGGSIQLELGAWPRAYRMLGKFVDGLHPIIVASREVCQALHGLLGEAVEVDEIQSQSGIKHGVLKIPESIIRKYEGSTLIKSCLVPRDETTAYQQWWGETKGEFFIANQPCYTLRRYKELLSADKIPIPPVPGEPAWNLLIRPHYCEMIPVNPEDMLMVAGYAATQHECQAGIDAYFAALPSGIPMKKRVWEAHKSVWESQHNFGAIIDFVAKRYFASS